MEPTYQPVDESLIQAEIEAGRRVSEFKETLATIRLKLNSAIERKKSLANEIRTILDEREHLINMFRDSIKTQWPEFAGLSVKEILSRITTVHPVYEIWKQFHKDIQSLNGSATSKLSQYKTLVKQVEGFESEQFAMMDAYGSYQSQSPVPVPSVEEIEAQVVDPLPTSIEEDVQVIEAVTALDLLDEQTQDALLIQQAELSASDMTEQTMMKATAIPGARDQKRTVLTVLGVLAFGYIFFGGRK